MNGDGGDPGGGIDLGSSDGAGGGGPPMGGGGGDGGPSYPGLSMSSDNPDMDGAPEEGEATIKFHKHSHTKERHPTKAGKHVHHVHLKVHSIKFHGAKRKKKVSKEDLASALAAAGPPGGADEEGGGGAPPPGGPPGAGGPPGM